MLPAVMFGEKLVQSSDERDTARKQDTAHGAP